jgi:hypothetical protein
MSPHVSELMANPSLINIMTMSYIMIKRTFFLRGVNGGFIEKRVL